MKSIMLSLFENTHILALTYSTYRKLYLARGPLFKKQSKHHCKNSRMSLSKKNPFPPSYLKIIQTSRSLALYLPAMPRGDLDQPSRVPPPFESVLGWIFSCLFFNFCLTGSPLRHFSLGGKVKFHSTLFPHFDLARGDS